MKALIRLGLAWGVAALVLSATSGVAAAGDATAPSDKIWSVSGGATPDNRDM